MKRDRTCCLHTYQSGFINGHSTVYQLLEIYQSVCQNLNERLSTILIFCDISKAFDRAWHEGLIKKLKSYGISGDLLIWFKNYLSGRRQFAFVNNQILVLSKEVYPKDLCLSLYYLYYILMTLQITQAIWRDCLLTTPHCHTLGKTLI